MTDDSLSSIGGSHGTIDARDDHGIGVGIGIADLGEYLIGAGPIAGDSAGVLDVGDGCTVDKRSEEGNEAQGEY